MKKNERRIRDVISQMQYFGLPFTIQCLVRRIISFKCYDKYMLSFLTKYFKPIIDSYRCTEFKEQDNCEKICVWSLWWQGESSAPDLVRVCLDSQRKFFAGEQFQYHVITKDNYNQYLELPDYIVSKVGEKITLTHFSDIIRAELIRKYGGLWIDATVYCSGLNQFQSRTKLDSIFTIKTRTESDYYTRGRWTGFLMGDRKGSLLFDFMSKCFRYYWKKESQLVAYLLIDYIIAIAYEQFDSVKEQIDAIPVSNQGMWKALYILNEAFDQEKWKQITMETEFIKLSYKDEFNGGPLVDKTKTGEPTFWKYIRDGEV